MTETVAIIPARGGSKRIPHKNILELNGLPLIAHTIRLVKGTGLFDRVIVSTDSEEIQRVASRHGGEVPFTRPAHISDDHASTIDVIRHAIKNLQLQLETMVCCVYPAAILTQKKTIETGLELIQNDTSRFSFPVTVFRSNPMRALALDSSTRCLTPKFEEFVSTRTQDLTELYSDAGQFYWGAAGAWLHLENIHANGLGIPVPWWEAIDLDTKDDLKFLTLAMQHLEELDT